MSSANMCAKPSLSSLDHRLRNHASTARCGSTITEMATLERRYARVQSEWRQSPTDEKSRGSSGKSSSYLTATHVCFGGNGEVLDVRGGVEKMTLDGEKSALITTS